MPSLFMVELAVSDVAGAVRWYRDVLGVRVLLADDRNGFVLLRGTGGSRLALKAGEPVPGGVTLHFEVPDLDAELVRLTAAGVRVESPTKASREGYREAFVSDPDGHTVGLFEWTTHFGERPA